MGSLTLAMVAPSCSWRLRGYFIGAITGQRSAVLTNPVAQVPALDTHESPHQAQPPRDEQIVHPSLVRFGQSDLESNWGGGHPVNPTDATSSSAENQIFMI